jgi:hypothetical protein
MSNTFLVAIERKLKYIDAMASCGSPPGTNKYETLIGDAILGLLKLVKMAKTIPEEDAVEFKSMIVPVFDESAVITLMVAVNAKVSLCSGVAPVTPKQENRFLDNYLASARWDLFGDTRIDQPTRLLAMAEFLKQGGMNHATEHTKSMAVVLALPETKSTETLLINLRLFKKLFSNVPDGQFEGPSE